MRLKEHEAIMARGEVFKVDPRALKVDPNFNVRDLDAVTARGALDLLKEQIRADGVQDPLEIRMNENDDLVITSGHRRHKVVMELIAEGVDIKTVPAIPEPKIIDEAQRVARIKTLNAGEPLSALEDAKIVARLLGFGWSRAQIAPVFGFKSEQSVANLELLLQAPVEVKDAVRNDELSASAAISMVRAHGPASAQMLEKARETAKAKGKTKLTAKATDGATAPAPEKPRNQLMVDKAMSLLHQVVKNDYAAAVAAEAYFALKAEDLAHILDWMTEFEDRIRQATEEDRAAMRRRPMAAD